MRTAKNKISSPKRRISDKWQLYAMIALPIAILIIFTYIPMYGIKAAFVDFINIRQGGILHSDIADPWYKWFRRMFVEDMYFWPAVKNTLVIALLKIVIGFPIPVIISLLLNEVRSKIQKKTIQTLIYLPYFLSWVVLSVILFQMFGSEGFLSGIWKKLFGHPLNVFTNSNQFVTMIVASDLWKTFGFSTVVYLASLTGISPELYEAAELDGANRFQQTVHVTVPGILPIVMLNGILNLGNIFNANFEQIFTLQNPLVQDKSEIIDTYVYKLAFADGNIKPYSTAIGLFKGIISAIVVVSVNVVCVKVTDYKVF